MKCIMIKIFFLHMSDCLRVPSKGINLHGFAKGWSSAPEEFPNPIFMSDSRIPNWLNGVLIRNGPALFEIGSTRVSHQFDGFAKLNKFNFSQGNVYYQSRFLQSTFYNRTVELGKLIPHVSMLPTVPRFKYMERIMSLLFKGALDNNNINIHSTGSTFYATSDSSASSVFDIETLLTTGLLNPSYTQHISAAHPQREVDNENTINYICDPSNMILRLYRDSAETGQRTFIGHVKLDHIPLIHSFAVTQDYAIIFHYPLNINTMSFLTGAASVVEAMSWMPRKDVTAYVFDLHSPFSCPPLYKFKIPSFFSMHCINAFQEKRGAATLLTIDLIAYPDAEFITSEDTYGALELMRDPTQIIVSNSHKMSPQMRRIQMKIKKVSVKRSRSVMIPQVGVFVDSTNLWTEPEEVICNMNPISANSFEMPCINPNLKGKSYTYVYGVTTSDMFSRWGISKTSVDSSYQVWSAPENHFPSEPIFVPKPSADREDEGVLISIILDANQNMSYILILDAQSLLEISNTYLPVVIPFDVHGKWITFN